MEETPHCSAVGSPERAEAEGGQGVIVTGGADTERRKS